MKTVESFILRVYPPEHSRKGNVPLGTPPSQNSATPRSTTVLHLTHFRFVAPDLRLLGYGQTVVDMHEMDEDNDMPVGIHPQTRDQSVIDENAGVHPRALSS